MTSSKKQRNFTVVLPSKKITTEHLEMTKTSSNEKEINIPSNKSKIFYQPLGELVEDLLINIFYYFNILTIYKLLHLNTINFVVYLN